MWVYQLKAALRKLSLYLCTEAIVQTVPDVYKSKAGGFVEEITQKDADAAVRPAAVDQKQPAQEAKLGQGKVCILYCLTTFHTTQAHTYMCSFGKKKRKKSACGERWEREEMEHCSRSGSLFGLIYCPQNNTESFLFYIPFQCNTFFSLSAQQFQWKVEDLKYWHISEFLCIQVHRFHINA